MIENQLYCIGISTNPPKLNNTSETENQIA